MAQGDEFLFSDIGEIKKVTFRRYLEILVVMRVLLSGALTISVSTNTFATGP